MKFPLLKLMELKGFQIIKLTKYGFIFGKERGACPIFVDFKVRLLMGKFASMNREIHKWFSPALDKDWEIAVYGYSGKALLMFPTAAADFLENERFYLIDAIAPIIESGKFKAFSINSINSESWLNEKMEPKYKAIRHQQYNDYVVNEVVPFIHDHCN